jgi:hypothetical protein
MPEMKVMVGLDESDLPKHPGVEWKAGDTKIMWSEGNRDEVSAAQDTFTSLIKRGFKAFAVKSNGEAGKEIKEFDASAEKLIMIPQMRGGA